MVIPAPSFDPVATLQAVQDERCTSLYGVPTMFIAELEHPEFGEFDLSSLRTGIMAGSPCPIETMRRCVEEMHMEEVTICYGMTETSPVSTQTGADDPLEKRVGTVGRVHPHVEVKVIDPETGAVVGRGEPGELCTRAYSVMLGYWDEPEKTADAIDRARWMHTGDLAQMDEDGYVKIVGRIKDMAELDRDAVAEFCQGKIAHYKVPRYVQVVSEFPMTVTGKVQKYKLREQAIEQLGLAEVETA
jgi:fatty-acyl-CoA synthase